MFGNVQLQQQGYIIIIIIIIIIDVSIMAHQVQSFTRDK